MDTVIRSYKKGDVIFPRIDIAKEMFRHHLTEYYNGLHGYIMQDGTCIELGCDDHNTICRIPQLMINMTLLH